jgi:hypothetical protein
LTRCVEAPTLKLQWRVSCPNAAPAEPTWGYPMNTELLIVILSIVALHVAALVGGGLALGVMRLLGRTPPGQPAGDAAETAH